MDRRESAGRRWKVGELAEAAGLTVRALHHFDEIGLVRPSERTCGGHRLYTDDDVRRLYLVVGLRQLRIPLADIAASLAGDLAPIVRAQLTHVEQTIGQQHRLRHQLAELIRVLDTQSAPSVDQLLELLETMMTLRYFTPDQLTRMKARHAEVGNDTFGRWRTEWMGICEEVRRHIEVGLGPAEQAAQETARRWSRLMTEMTGGDRAVLAGMYAKMDGQGAEAATLDVVTSDVWEYMKRAFAVGFG